MYIENWLLSLSAVVLVWSIWLNVARAKQIKVLQFSFSEMSDFAKNSLTDIYKERVETEGDADLVPYIITRPLEDWDTKVDFLLELQFKAGVPNYHTNYGAEVLHLK